MRCFCVHMLYWHQSPLSLDLDSKSGVLLYNGLYMSLSSGLTAHCIRAGNGSSPPSPEDLKIYNDAIFLKA